MISTIATVGNYEYGYFWYLYNDATIEYEVKLTGVISTGAIAPGETPTHGTLVAPGLYGPHHQHFFCVRLDMTVDGPPNTVVEIDSVPSPPGPTTRTATRGRSRATVLASEAVARRDVDAPRARYWKIESAEQVCARPADRLRAHAGRERAADVLPPDALYAGAAGFTQHQLWVTAYDPTSGSRRATTPTSTPGGNGLPPT